MRIPKSGCHWGDQTAGELEDCHFQVFFTKIGDVQEECANSDRKQTKVDTIIEGLKSIHNTAAAKALVGKKFLISRSGRPLQVTTLPTDVLRKFGLPQEFEDEINGKQPNNPSTPSNSGAFQSFANSAFAAPKNPVSDDSDSRRVSLAAKCMFMQLAASMQAIYSDETNDLVIVEIKDTTDPTTLVESVFDGGEHPEGYEHYNISFGLIKDVIV